MTLLADLLSTVFERRYRTAKSVHLGGRPLAELAEELVGNHEVFETSRAVMAKPDVNALAESADFDPIRER
jgi:malonyl-CoA decarboxylase